MPIINIKLGPASGIFTPEQKHELIRQLTNTFVRVLGEVVRPFTYVVIEETKMFDYGISGRPMPDLAWLSGPEYNAIMAKSQDIMRAVVAQMQQQQAPSAQSESTKATTS